MSEDYKLIKALESLESIAFDVRCNSFVAFLKIINHIIRIVKTHKLQYVLQQKNFYIFKTPIHEKVISKCFKDDKLQTNNIELSGYVILWLVIRTLVKYNYTTRNLSLSKILFQFYFLTEYFYLWIIDHDGSTKYTNIGCFELGSTGVATSIYCKLNNKMSVFLQHGFIDTMLKPCEFDKLYVRTKKDVDFFSPVCAKSEFHFITQKRSSFPKDKVAVWALEYATDSLLHEEMLPVIKKTISALLDSSWTVILKTHPRERNIENFSDLVHLGASFSNKDIITLAREKNVSLLLTFNSAAIFDAIELDILPVTFLNRSSSRVNVIWSDVSWHCTEILEFERLLSLDSDAHSKLMSTIKENVYQCID